MDQTLYHKQLYVKVLIEYYLQTFTKTIFTPETVKTVITQSFVTLPLPTYITFPLNGKEGTMLYIYPEAGELFSEIHNFIIENIVYLMCLDVFIQIFPIELKLQHYKLFHTALLCEDRNNVNSTMSLDSLKEFILSFKLHKKDLVIQQELKKYKCKALLLNL